MTAGNEMRGYDDTKYLEAMGHGIMTGEYSSVEQAARAVLQEDGGSNVDRLRRKFRQDGWFVKSRDEYVRFIRYGPKPVFRYGEPKNMTLYGFQAGIRFWKHPIKNAIVIIKGGYHDAKGTQAMLAFAAVLVVVFSFHAYVLFRLALADRTYDLLQIIWISPLILFLTVGLSGDAQAMREFYRPDDDSDIAPKRGHAGSTSLKEI
jgi:hypothetical protein